MKEKTTSRPSSKTAESNSKLSKLRQEAEGGEVYEGNNCVTHYWAAPGGLRLPSPYDALAEELTAKATEKRKKKTAGA